MFQGPFLNFFIPSSLFFERKASRSWPHESFFVVGAFGGDSDCLSLRYTFGLCRTDFLDVLLGVTSGESFSVSLDPIGASLSLFFLWESFGTES